MFPPKEVICCARTETPAPIPKCSLIAKKIKKSRMPAFDTFGPFPDETLMSSIDRVLFLFGARKVQKFFNLPCPTLESDNNSDCSFSVTHIECPKEHEPYRTCSTYIEECLATRPPTYSVIKKSKCSLCEGCSVRTTTFREPLPKNCSPTPRICRKEPICKKNNSKTGLSLQTLRRSFSLCSLACRKLKNKLTFANSSPTCTPRWLWTKQSQADGCKVYEVYKNSSVTSHPTKFECDNAPKIIFVILPTGTIMPFETLSCH